MTDKQFQLIGHSLGINTYDAELSKRQKDKTLPDEFYRNYFCAGNSEILELENAVNDGLMVKWNQFNQLYYGVSEKGIGEFRVEFTQRISNTFKKPSKSIQHYLDYLHNDGSDTFAEFLGIVKPTVEYDRYGNYRFVSQKYRGLFGEWAKTKKAAKESYKQKLKELKSK
jgi:hypothetical protein